MLTKKQKLILTHCYSDLYRTAKDFYLHPQGQNYWTFLHHCQNNLKTIPLPKVKNLLFQLNEAENKLKVFSGRQPSKAVRQNLADKILTLGILLKNC